MPTAIADGPGGLECVHQVNGLDLGEQASFPRYKLDRITGLFSLPEADDDRRPRTAMIGEVTYPSYPRGKTIVYEGRVQSSDLQELREMSTALRSACGERSLELPVYITPDAAWGADHWGYYGRVMQLDMDEEQIVSPLDARGPYQRRFTLGLRMSDPRFYYKLAGGAGLQSIAGATTAQVATNSGTAPSDPVFTIVVPGGTPDIVITNTDVPTSNGSARLRFNDVPSGTLVVNFATRTVVSDGDDAFATFDTVYNQWWDELIPGLAPGANHLDVSGDTNWSVAWWHRSW